MEVGQLHYSLRQLRYFVVTAEVLSFTAAAKKLHISQPSISTALADLEASFGVQLFTRHHASGLSLTQAGRDGTVNLLVDARPNTQYLRIANLSGKALQHRSARHAFPRLEGLGA
jgi:Bacterial regulatory helix-turn-helix protein, lysR family